MADPFYRDENGVRRVNAFTRVSYKGKEYNAGEELPEEKQEDKQVSEEVDNG